MAATSGDVTEADLDREYGAPIEAIYLLPGESLVPDLRGPRGFKELRRMAETDDTIGAMLWAVETTLAQLEWSHEAMDGAEPSQSPEAEAAADYADSVLEDMSHTFQDHVEEGISFLWAGFSLGEVNFKIRDGVGSNFDDGLWGIDNIVTREQETVTEWLTERNRLTAVRQMGSTGTFDIPMWKLLHYRIRATRSRPQGRSLFTNAHRSWVFKNQIQESEAIGIRRELAGLPIFELPMADIEAASTPGPDGELSPKGKIAKARLNEAKKAARDLRLNEAAGLVIPSDTFPGKDGEFTQHRQYNYRVLTGAGQRTIDTRGPIRDYDRAIARAAMMQFLHLGDRSTGSYALSDNQSTLALRSMRALVGKIVGEWRRKTLPLLFEVNGMPRRYLPRLRSTPITEDNLDTIGEFLDRLASAAEFLEDEPELKEAMMDRMGVRRRRTRVTAPPTDGGGE